MDVLIFLSENGEKQVQTGSYSKRGRREHQTCRESRNCCLSYSCTIDLRGNLSIEDNRRSGCPQEVDRVAVINAVEEHTGWWFQLHSKPYRWNTEWSRLVFWSKVNSNFQEYNDLKIDDFSRSSQNPDNGNVWKLRQDSFAQLAITLFQTSCDIDKNWILFVNDECHGEWRTQKRDFWAKKAMGCVWWDKHGTIFWEIIENDKTVNSDVYLNPSDFSDFPRWQYQTP